MRDILKLAGILFLITAIASLFLGFTNMITKDKIADQIEEENKAARMEVMPEADDFEPVDQSKVIETAKSLSFENPEVIAEVSAAKQGDDIVGYTIKSLPSGFGGEITVLTGVSLEGKITGMKVIGHSETPGLGAKSTEPEFQDQYKEKPVENPLVVVKMAPSQDNEIQAITGATITSSAVTEGVNLSLEIFKELIK